MSSQNPVVAGHQYIPQTTGASQVQTKHQGCLAPNSQDDRTACRYSPLGFGERLRRLRARFAQARRQGGEPRRVKNWMVFLSIGLFAHENSPSRGLLKDRCSMVNPDLPAASESAPGSAHSSPDQVHSECRSQDLVASVEVQQIPDLSEDQDLALREELGLPTRLTPMTATCRVPPLSRVKLGIGWSRGVARDAEQ